MIPITVSLTKNDIEKIDNEVARQKLTDDTANRSKVIRAATRIQLGIVEPV